MNSQKIANNFLSTEDFDTFDALQLWTNGQEFTTPCTQCGNPAEGFTLYEENAWNGTDLLLNVECSHCAYSFLKHAD